MVNKGTQIAFSLLVGFTVVTVGSLLYMSRDKNPYKMKYNNEKQEAIKAVSIHENTIKKIKSIFSKYDVDDDEDEKFKNDKQKQIILNLVNENIEPDEAIKQANAFIKSVLPQGGKRTKRVTKRLKPKSKSKYIKN
jgi:hypothetical protein